MSPRSEERVRENRLRRAADRQGLRLMKSRVRDPNGLTFGTYMLVSIDTGGVITGSGPANRGYGLDLDEIEAWLNRQ